MSKVFYLKYIIDTNKMYRNISKVKEDFLNLFLPMYVFIFNVSAIFMSCGPWKNYLKNIKILTLCIFIRLRETGNHATTTEMSHSLPLLEDCTQQTSWSHIVCEHRRGTRILMCANCRDHSQWKMWRSKDVSQLPSFLAQQCLLIDLEIPLKNWHWILKAQKTESVGSVKSHDWLSQSTFCRLWSLCSKSEGYAAHIWQFC